VRTAPAHRDDGEHHEKQEQAGPDQQAGPVDAVGREAQFDLAGYSGGYNPALLPAVHHDGSEQSAIDARQPARIRVLPNGENEFLRMRRHAQPTLGRRPLDHAQGGGSHAGRCD
jgi:hypothetical protein